MWNRGKFLTLLLALLTALGSHPVQGIPPTAHHGDARSATDKTPHERLVREYLWANARFPQMNAMIRLRMFRAYLTENISATEFLAEPTDKELESVMLAMNGMHRRHGVVHRTPDAPDARPEALVQPKRLKDLMRAFISTPIMRGRGLVDVAFKLTGTEEERLAWLRALYQTQPKEMTRDERTASILDALFTQNDAPRVAATLKKAGAALDAMLNSEAFEAMSREYLAVIQANTGRDRKSARYEAAKRVAELAHAMLNEALHKALPELDAESLAELEGELFPPGDL